MVIILLVLVQGSMLFGLNIEENYIDVGYGSIWYKKYFFADTCEKTPLLIVHGGPGFSHNYLISLLNLVHERPVIFYDQSGCGNSKLLDSAIDWSLDHFVHELKLIIDFFQMPKIILLGYSWGAAISLKFAYENPHLVEKMILASPYLSTSHLLDNYKMLAESLHIYDRIKYHETCETMDTNEYKELMAIFFKNFVFRGDRTLFDEFPFNHEMSEKMWGKKEFSSSGNLKEMNLISLLSCLKIPLLLTSGKYDTMTPAYMIVNGCYLMKVLICLI